MAHLIKFVSLTCLSFFITIKLSEKYYCKNKKEKCNCIEGALPQLRLWLFRALNLSLVDQKGLYK